MSQQPLVTSPLGFPAIRLGAVHRITTSGSSQQTPVMDEETTIFRINCDEDTYVEVGLNPVASTVSFKLAGGNFEYFQIGAGERIAVLQATVPGECQIVEGA